MRRRRLRRRLCLNGELARLLEPERHACSALRRRRADLQPAERGRAEPGHPREACRAREDDERLRSEHR